MLVNVTTTSLAAPAASVTVPVADSPCLTEVGLMMNLAILLGLSLTLPRADPPFRVAVTVAVVITATLNVLDLNVVLTAPAGTVIVGGTDNDGLELAKVTTSPPVGAGAVRVNVPTEVSPPIRAAGLKVTVLGVTTFTARSELTALPL